MSNGYVLDASAVVAWLLAEPGGDIVESLLTSRAHRVEIHALNLVEVLYVLRRRAGPASMDATLAALKTAAVSVEGSLDVAMIRSVAELKATKTPLSLADAVAVAFSIRRGATLLTTDRSEMEKLMGLCSIEFLR